MAIHTQGSVKRHRPSETADAAAAYQPSSLLDGARRTELFRAALDYSHFRIAERSPLCSSSHGSVDGRRPYTGRAAARDRLNPRARRRSAVKSLAGDCSDQKRRAVRD